MPRFRLGCIMTAGDAKREHDVRLVRLERSLVSCCHAEATGYNYHGDLFFLNRLFIKQIVIKRNFHFRGENVIFMKKINK